MDAYVPEMRVPGNGKHYYVHSKTTSILDVEESKHTIAPTGVVASRKSLSGHHRNFEQYKRTNNGRLLPHGVGGPELVIFLYSPTPCFQAKKPTRLDQQKPIY